jgi:hypothetical protein
MAMANDAGARPTFVASWCALIGPMAIQAAAWLTTVGHASTFREMNDSRGWIGPVGYGVHAAYVFALALSILLAPALRRRASSYTLAIVGLGLLFAGSLLNGLYLHAPYELALFGRIIAGFGVGQAMSAAPRLLPAKRPHVVDVFDNVMLACAPAVIALASVTYGWSDWEGAFLFQGVLALFALACVIPLNPEPEPPSPVTGSIAYWVALAIGIACIWYLLQWGQLRGWFDDPTVLLVAFVGAVALIASLWLAWPGLTPEMVRDGLPRVILVGYAGLVQFFQVAETGVFGGLFMNVGAVERARQVWPLLIGAGVALVVGRLTLRTTRPGRIVSIIGLLLITGGMAFAYTRMVGWPFWDVLNVVEFNWFSAPRTWEMAPGRFLVGFGVGLVILTEGHRAGRDAEREQFIAPVLPGVLFLAAGIGVGLLSTALLAGHQWEYSYAADRGDIQAAEVADRTALLEKSFAESGSPEPARKASVLMYRSVNYQADALVFANIYAGFGIMSATLAAVLIGRMIWDRLCGSGSTAGVVRTG